MVIKWQSPGIYKVRKNAKVKIAHLFMADATDNATLNQVVKDHLGEGYEFFIIKEKPVLGKKFGTQEVRAVTE